MKIFKESIAREKEKTIAELKDIDDTAQQLITMWLGVQSVITFVESDVSGEYCEQLRRTMQTVHQLRRAYMRSLAVSRNEEEEVKRMERTVEELQSCTRHRLDVHALIMDRLQAEIDAHSTDDGDNSGELEA